MASEYWSPGRQRVCRLQAAFVRMNDIVRDLVDIRISEKQGWESPSLSDHWQQWCYDNYDHVKRYHFWKDLAKEKYNDKEIPFFEKVDVSFFAHLMKKIDPECVGMSKFRECRNFIAHMTDDELDEFDFHDHLQAIIAAVNESFHGQPELRRKWRSVLDQIRTEDFSDSAAKHLQQRFREQAETVKLSPVAVTNVHNNINNNNNINVNIAFEHVNDGEVFLVNVQLTGVRWAGCCS